MEPEHPRKWRRVVISVGVLLVFLLAGDLLLTRARRQVPIAFDTTRVSGPVESNGVVDYVAALDAEFSKGVTDDNNAARLLMQAFGPNGLPAKHRDAVAKILHIPVPPERGAYLISFYDFQAPAADRLELDEGPWPIGNPTLVAEWIKANETPLRLILQASQRPRFFIPMRADGQDQSILVISMPYLNLLRDSAMLLAAHARLCADVGDLATARSDLQAIHRLARLLSQSPNIVGCMVATGIEAFACNTSRGIAQHAKIDTATAELFLKDAMSLQELPSFARAVDYGERYNVLQFAMSYATRGAAATSRLYGNGSAPAGQDSQINFLLPIRHADAMRMENAAFDSLVAAFGKKTRAERTTAFQAANQFCVAPIPRMVAAAYPQLVLSIVLPAIFHAQDMSDRATADLRMTQISWALTMYRLKNHRFPATLDELSPQFLPVVPLDLFSEAPFVYSLKESGYTLYSVGINGIDDHGATTAPADDLLLIFLSRFPMSRVQLHKRRHFPRL